MAKPQRNAEQLIALIMEEIEKHSGFPIDDISIVKLSAPAPSANWVHRLSRPNDGKPTPIAVNDAIRYLQNQFDLA